MTSYKPVTDPWEEAMNPPELPQGYHGKITLYANTVMFVEDPTNQGKKIKVPYDPQVKQADGSDPRAVSMIKICLTPVNENLKWDIVRELLVTSTDWTKITLPSIKDLGVMKLPELDGRYAQVEMVDTGRSYQSNGETKQATTFKFIRLFADENECKAAAGIAPAAAAPAAAPGGNGSNGGNERATAEKFLAVYVTNAVRNSGKDLDKTRQALQAQLAQQALLAKYFTVDSPEVVNLIMEEMAK